MQKLLEFPDDPEQEKFRELYIWFSFKKRKLF